MTDLSNLHTASLYINNQLLSRGLLRDGRALNFADPSGQDSKPADDDAIDNTADTMARIISVINDLILRRDRDAEHRESLSTALRTVRAESLRQANDLQRALERHADAQRRADIGEAAETSLRAQLAAADSANRKLREEAIKMRQLVSQIRASCANEVRKRDRQIDGLKKAVSDAGRARGERRSPAITTITIGGGDQQQPSRSNFTSPRTAQSTPASHKSAASAAAASTTTADSDYNLRSETNAFLAELARGLSDDNEVLLSLVHHMSRQLKTMSGFVADETNNDEKATAKATNSNGNDYSALAGDMEAVLDHLRTILTNPSFVPIEEVVQRESEIGRLRDGWEKMEDRWKEAVHLLDGWRQRMADSGRSVNMEEIKMGLRLSPVRVRSVAETTQSLGLRLPPLHEALGEEDEEEYDDQDDQDDAQEYPSLGHSPSPAESLRLVPAPRDPRFAENKGGAELSDSESDASSVFSDEDEPNVQIIEQSALMPSLEPSPAPETFSRSTPSPSPPPPRKPALSKVTTAVLKESGKVAEEPKSSDAAKKDKIPPMEDIRKDKAAGKAALQPSHTAGNRGGVNGPIPAAAPTAPEAKKGVATEGVRGRRRAGEGEPSTARPATRPAGPRAAITGVTRSDPKRTAAPRPVTSAATGTRQAKPSVHATASAKPAPSSTTTGRPTKPVSALSRPASAASHVSEGSSSGVTSVASARPAPHDKLQKQQQATTEKPASKAATAAPSTTSTLDQMPPPPAPAAAAPSTITGASRARSRSPLKIATSDGTSRLPLPTTAVPPASPALNMASIAAKLAASEREADAARVRAKLKAMRSGLAASAKTKALQPASASSSMASARTISGGSEAIASSATSTTTEIDSVDPVKKAVAPVDTDPALGTSINSNKSMGDDQDQVDLQQQPLRKKRDRKDNRRASRVASRRRSTLNPWELKTLMTGGADSETADEARES
ncbi:nima interactive protein [Ophiostoma piceae UAMH 11346]|uniref:Nima interactive protein n=1 Tax=Ophiostoma piceae (strain UAMH 11346) TaxID=1262450 RepID=S3CU44_OPHP1|nr:nima interactive protein [Ophiostoma piceae UAMH 11346]